MKPYLLTICTLLAGVLVTITACKKEKAPETAANYSYTEEFDTLAHTLQRGWVVKNNSRPLGTDGWIQGQFGIDEKGKLNGYSAASYSYSGQDFVCTTFNSGDSVATISSWLISPVTFMKNGDQIEFYTRTLENPTSFPDRLQLRLNGQNAEANVGTGPLANKAVAEMTGDFSIILLEINPQLSTGGTNSYPDVWTKYTATITGLQAPENRRFAFRYYVTDAGPDGSNSQGIGVDAVRFISK